MSATGRIEMHELDAAAQRQARVDDLSSQLQRAERAVSRATSADAAAVAHRRADALLLELEAAEDGLRSVIRPSVSEAPILVAAQRRRGKTSPPAGQMGLFNVG